MSRPLVLVTLAVVITLGTFWLLLQTPGSLNDALAHPFAAIAGTSHNINATLLDASESADSIRAAGRKLLMPTGIVSLVKIYKDSDAEPSRKP